MVKPPTKLGAFFYHPTPAAIVDAMIAHGCLSDQARRRDVIALVTRELEGGPSEGPQILGPSRVDQALSALWEAGYLSTRGQEWARTIRGPDDTAPPPPPAPPGLLRRLAMLLRR
jgi:hypothetical protein